MQTLGIYIQFPFCASKCSFCNFSSRVEPLAAYDPYLRALNLEMELLPKGLPSEGYRPDLLSLTVDSVYCGGGTPSLAGPEGLASIFLPLRRMFRTRDVLEWTLEITPGSASQDFLRSMMELGVNRLSIGAQSFNDRELSSVGRLHSASGTEEQVAVARKAGFRNLNLDLIAGLPYQTEASWRSSLQAVTRLRPEHVSVYLFEADGKSRLGREVNAKGSRYHARATPGDDFMADAYERARENLAQEGYAQYEISNFALPGYESLHNQKYWQLDPYLGLGAGAHSFDGCRRWFNEVEPVVYQARLQKGELPVDTIRALSATEQAEEFFFLGLRQRHGVSLDVARSRWGNPSFNWWEERARELEREGFLIRQDGHLRLAERAYLVSNEIFQRFLM